MDYISGNICFYSALNPGGIPGVVEYRENESAKLDLQASNGYVKKSNIIKIAREKSTGPMRRTCPDKYQDQKSGDTSGCFYPGSQIHKNNWPCEVGT